MSTSENCTHDCSTCGESCSDREATDFREYLMEGAAVRKVYAVVSGKGGVGKSLITSLLASEMQRREYRTAVLDADITGPSIPKTFGSTSRAMATETYMIPNYTKTGIQIMSANMVVEDPTDPLVWRGPVIAGVVAQFWNQVMWDDVDFMFVDMPPGTGDVPLTVFQSLPVDGIIIVTSPQDLVSMIVEKAVKMAKLMNVPIFGIVENYSYFKCPDCGKEHHIFGESNIDEIAAKYGIENIVKIPIDPEFAKKVDAGDVESLETPFLAPICDKLESEPFPTNI